MSASPASFAAPLFGPVKSIDALFGTPYGLTFLAAIAFGLFLALPTRPEWMNRLHADWVGFLAVFSAMILMHFGL